MEGKILYGKITSPKVIAEASHAYSFSFDLQRFDGPKLVPGATWVEPTTDKTTHQFVYSVSGGAENGIASLSSVSGNKMWSLTTADSNTSSIVAFNLGDTQFSNLKYRKIDAHSATAALSITSDDYVTSIMGGSGADSIIGGGVAVYIGGGSGADYLKAGSKGSTLFGGEDTNTLVGGSGVDYFVFGGTGSDSISGYEADKDFISLQSDAFPGVGSIASDSNNLILNLGTGSISIAGASASEVALKNSSTTYYYNKDYIRSAPSTGKASFSLTSAASSLDASSYSAVSIDGTAATGDSGLKIFGTSGNDSIIGSNSASNGTSIYGYGGNDFVSLAGTQTDIFVYNGSGDASIKGLGTNGYVSLSATKASLITAGSALTSLAGSDASKSSFKLTFGTNNALTFLGTSSASIKAGTNTLVYTPTAISLASGDASSVTLGSSYNSAEFNGSSFSLVSGAAVGNSITGDKFAIKGGYSSTLIGSDSKITSLLGGEGANILYAGKAGASLNGHGGADLLVGSSGVDWFIYDNGGAPSIRSYTYGKDTVVAQGTAVPTTNINGISLDSSSSTFRISLGAAAGTASVMTFESANKVNIVSLGTDVRDTLFHYEADRIIVNNDRITLGPSYSSNFNANANTWTNNDYVLSSINAAAITVAGGINITGFESKANSIIGAQYGGKLVGSDGADYLESGVTTTTDYDTVTTTLDGGAEGDDTLVGGTGKDYFIYKGGKDSIGKYSSTYDTVEVSRSSFNMLSTEDPPVFASLEDGLKIGFSNGNSLTIASSVKADDKTFLIKNGTHYFNYSAGAVSLDSKSVTLTSDYQFDDAGYAATASITAVNAEAASIANGNFVSLTANDSYGTRLIGSKNYANSLVSGAKNDYMQGGTSAAADIFVYTGAGKDTVANYQYSVKGSGDSFITDSLVADSFVDSIASGKVTGTRLIFTKDNKNSLTFLSDDEAIEKVSIGGTAAGYLTKDAYVKTGGSEDTLKLFASARGRIELNAAPYSVTGANAITSINAAAVTQSVTLVAGSLSSASNYILPVNKKRDRFEYAGGAVSISGYESGKDQLNLGIGTISGFEVSGNNVLISLSSSENDVVSILGSASNKASDMNFLVHQSTDGTSTYRKMAFNQSGILTNKASKPTAVTVLSGADSLNATDLSGGTIKKIYAAAGLSGISIEAGNKNNTQINIANAGGGMSIYGGKKNDKITGSTVTPDKGDLFIYKLDNNIGGKDVITNFDDSKDTVSIGDNPDGSLSTAKISTRNKGVTFKFAGNKNSLALKSSDTISAVNIAGTIAGTNYTFKKNAFSKDNGATVSLTSAFSGNFDISKTKLGDDTANTIDGHLLEKNVTFKGTSEGETIIGGNKKKTTFRGGGGTDSLVGGAGKDVFFYAKGDAGNTTIANFDYKNDKIKLASGTLAKIETTGSGVQLSMKDSSGSNIGWYNIASDSNGSAPGANTVFKANNTYFWFAKEDIKEKAEVTVRGSDETTETIVAEAKTGDLITWNTRVSSSDISGLDVIDLGYSTNLVKSKVAVAFSKDKAPIPTKS